MWNEHDSTLLLQWESNCPLTKKCVVYMVRILCNQKDTIQVRRYDIMTILHSFYQLSHLHLSFSPSRQTWQKCHTVSLRSHRTSTMFSKSGALLLMSVVLRISGVTGVLQWSGAVQVGQWGTRRDLLSLAVFYFPIVLLCFLEDISRRGWWQWLYGILSVLLLLLLVVLLCYFERWGMFKTYHWVL